MPQSKRTLKYVKKSKKTTVDERLWGCEKSRLHFIYWCLLDYALCQLTPDRLNDSIPCISINGQVSLSMSHWDSHHLQLWTNRDHVWTSHSSLDSSSPSLVRNGYGRTVLKTSSGLIAMYRSKISERVVLQRSCKKLAGVRRRGVYMDRWCTGDVETRRSLTWITTAGRPFKDGSKLRSTWT